MAECVGLKPQSLDWCEGAVNLPGIRRDVYFIAKRDVLLFPTRKTEYVTGMGEIATLTGNFTLASEGVAPAVTSAFWKKLSVIVDKSPVTSASQGTRPSKSFLNSATFVHPGVEEDAAAFCALANNDDYLYLVQTKNGKYRLIGNEMYQTETNPSQNLGSEATSEMGTTIEVSVTDSIPAPFYTGEIIVGPDPLTDVINKAGA